MEAQTGETPKALLTKPRLHPWVEWLWDAFWMLDSGRPIHQGSVGRIPLSEIAAFLAIFAVGDDEAKQSFITMMRALDSVYVEKINAEIARKIESDRKSVEEKRFG